MCGLAQGGSSPPVPESSAAAASSNPAAPRGRSRRCKQGYHQQDYEVECIVDHQYCEDGWLEYCIQWRSYGADDMTWQSDADCANCAKLVNEYWDRTLAAAAAEQ
jgi:hypothetical protein